VLRKLLLSVEDIRAVFFILALGIYAIRGSPTPDQPGMVELIIALLLLFSIGILKPAKNIFFQFKEKRDKWFVAGCVLWLWGISVPLILSVVYGADRLLVFRDVAGFVFLCFPIFFYGFVEGHLKRTGLLLWGCVLIGIMFALRTLYDDFPVFNQTNELLYLANSPLVLFSTLFLGVAGFFKIYQRVSLKSLLVFFVYMALTCMLMLAMYEDLLRASFASIGFSIVVLLAIGFVRAPKKILPVFVLCALVIFIFHEAVFIVWQDVLAKTSRVGLNMRLQEWHAVWDVLGHSWVSLMFGQGWGSSFASPAVGGLHVTFTHNLLSYMLLKAGLAGLILSLVYLFFIFEKLMRVVFSDPVKGNALLWPFVIPIVLYASHKSFDYGLLLVLILALASQYRQQKE
jgi:hypothetical protein